MNVAINHLEVRWSPVAEQFRPSFIAMVTPDPEQWNPVIYLRVPPQPPAALTATPPLEAT